MNDNLNQIFIISIGKTTQRTINEKLGRWDYVWSSPTIDEVVKGICIFLNLFQ